MATPENYSVTEHLRDGREVEIRALRSEDKDDMRPVARGLTKIKGIRWTSGSGLFPRFVRLLRRKGEPPVVDQVFQPVGGNV